MFLRNIGRSYDLAIIDRHVLRYMQATGLISDQVPPSTLLQYEALEKRLTDQARIAGYPVGLLDWAIWIVMRAAKQVRA